MGKGKGTFEFWATRCATRMTGHPRFANFSKVFPLAASSSRSAGYPFVKSLLATVCSICYPSYLVLTKSVHIVLRQAAAKLPTTMEFIDKSTPPRLGYLVLDPPKPTEIDPSTIPENVSSALPTASS